MTFFLNSRPLRFVRPPNDGWMPRLWASRVPLRRIDNFVEVFRALWENRDNLPYALRILQHGVCDGCALGTTGLRDWTIDGVHLCNVRLRLLRLNTIKAFDPALLADVAPLRDLRARDLRALGRLATPMIRKRGERGFRCIGWDDALDLIANAIRETTPERTYTYLTSRGIPNETYYAVQKAVRAMGSSNLDNAARICHSPSTYGLRDALGVGATTCSYSDLIGTDLVTFIGSNPAANQPVMMKYLYHAKKAGTQIALINPFREPAMEQYWIPSEVESALFGTRFTDHFFQIRAGSDIAFLHGAVKHILAQGRYDAAFVTTHTVGFDALKATVEALSWEALEAQSGVSAAQMQAYGDLVASAERAVFVWGMGITHHTSGEDNVHAIINLALLKGFVGREGCGLMPIRGHSGVQGGAEMGAYATALPGGLPVNATNAAALSAQYGFDVPAMTGMTTPEMLDAAARGEIDVLFAVGGNFREVMPDPQVTSDGIRRIPLRVHMDITLSSQMLLDPADTVVLLPALTRYEIDGGVTETSTERRVIYSPRIRGKRPPDARSEGEVLGEIAARVKPQLADKVRFTSTRAIRAEIAQVIPQYTGIETLEREGDQFQYGGSLLCKDWQFPTPDGKAHFYAAPLPDQTLASDEFILVTRRGKQFNSMVHEDKEGATGYGRDAVLISAADARRLGLAQGESVQLSNDVGSYVGRVQIADLATGMVQVYWPEANTLLDSGTRSPKATVPAYKGGRVKLSHAAQAESAASAIKV
jgi:molybdopterin-dependent oxidoreductase alpha subunit